MTELPVFHRGEEGRSYSVKKVAFGLGLAMMAWSNMRLARLESKFRAADKAATVLSLVMFLPSRCKNP